MVPVVEFFIVEIDVRGEQVEVSVATLAHGILLEKIYLLLVGENVVGSLAVGHLGFRVGVADSPVTIAVASAALAVDVDSNSTPSDGVGGSSNPVLVQNFDDLVDLSFDVRQFLVSGLLISLDFSEVIGVLSLGVRHAADVILDPVELFVDLIELVGAGALLALFLVAATTSTPTSVAVVIIKELRCVLYSGFEV